MRDEEQVVTEEKDEKRKKKRNKSDGLMQKMESNPVRTVRKLIDVTENAMRERVTTWERYRRKYRRGIYYLRQTDGGVPLYFTNYIFAMVESTKSNMTRNLPQLTVAPRGFRDDLAADLLTRLFQDSLDRGGLRRATRQVVHHALLATMAWFKVFYDEEINNNVIECVAPEDVMIDPKAHEEKDARWIIHRIKDMSADAIYDKYGKVPKWDETNEQERGDDRVNQRDGIYSSRGERQPAMDVTPCYDVYECWVRSYEKDRENDWYIVTIAGDTVLREEYSVYDHNKSPFVPWFDVEDFGADNIYHRGVGSVEQIEPLQDRADALDLRIYKNISLLSNRQRYISAHAGVNPNTIDNSSGRTYVVNGDPRLAVFYDSPPMLSMDVYNYRTQTEGLMQTVSGIFDVTQGKRPTGITAGRAIESLKDSAETRLASKVDTLAEVLKEVGSRAIQNILQFFDGEAVLRATDGDEDKDFVIIADYPESLYPEDDMAMPPGMFDMMGQQPMMPPETMDLMGGGMMPPDPMMEGIDPMAAMGGGMPPMEQQPDLQPGNTEPDEELMRLRQQWKEENGIALVLSDVTYALDVMANTDNALPSAKAERGQVASDLFRLGAIDREALLTSLEFPQRHKILQRLAQDVTGKDAGDPQAEAGTGVIEQFMEALTSVLQGLGLDEQQIQEVVQMMQQQKEWNEGPQQPDTGNFPAQMTI